MPLNVEIGFRTASAYDRARHLRVTAVALALSLILFFLCFAATRTASRRETASRGVAPLIPATGIARAAQLAIPPPPAVRAPRQLPGRCLCGWPTTGCTP